MVCEFHNYARSDVRRITFSRDKGREACVCPSSMSGGVRRDSLIHSERQKDMD